MKYIFSTVFPFISSILKSLQKKITGGHERSIRAKVNIAASFLIKGLSMGIGFLMVPLTLEYINPTSYGIWLTLSSFIGWFSFFDIGLGNGLRNKFAESKAKGKIKLARIYVSTTYALLCIIIFFILLLFLIVNPFIDWVKVFNAPRTMEGELSILLLIVFCSFCVKFILQLISSIVIADQKPALSGMYNLIANLLSFIWIFALTKTTQGSLLNLGIALSLSPIIVFFLASIILFSNKYKAFSPSIKLVNIKYTRGLINIGFQFFIIQISTFVLFTSANMIISQLFGPAEVTPYNISYRLLGIIMMIFSIIQTPFWSAYTDAYYKNDVEWIKRINKKMIKVWIYLVLATIILLICSPAIYRIWIGDKVTIPFHLSLFVAIFFILNSWNSIFVLFLNGIGKIRLQLYFSICESIAFIPLAIIFSKTFNLGISGIVIASCIPLFAGAIWAPLQFYKIISNNASGLWNK